MTARSQTLQRSNARRVLAALAVVWKPFGSQPVSAVALVTLTLILLAAMLAPVIAPFPADASGTSHMERRLQAPSLDHPFGTDQLGRDVLSRVIFGARISLAIALLAVLVSGAVGTAWGLMAGYAGGWLDSVLMRIADVFLGIPALVLAMLVSLTFGGGIQMTVIAIAFTWWPQYARLIRGEVLRVRTLDYVEAARAFGAGNIRIVVKHLFPATVPVLVVQGAVQMGQAILVAASLGFIGLGARPPSPEWGLAVAIGREYLPDLWWPSMFPGLAIVVTVISFNLVGDVLRVVLDPKARKK